MPTGVSDDFDPVLLGEALDDWVRTGRIRSAFMDTEQVATAILDLLAAVLPLPGIGLEFVELRSPAPVLGSPHDLGQVRAGAADEAPSAG